MAATGGPAARVAAAVGMDVPGVAVVMRVAMVVAMVASTVVATVAVIIAALSAVGSEARGVVFARAAPAAE